MNGVEGQPAEGAGLIAGADGALVAGAWLGPGLVALLGFGMLRLVGAQADVTCLLAAIALSLLAGGPAALLVARHGWLGWPAGLACLGAGLGALALLRVVERLSGMEALAGGLASAALALLWIGLGVAAGFGLPPLLGLVLGVVVGAALAWLLGGLGGVFWGMAMGAALAGFLATVPAAAAPARPRLGEGRVLAGSALVGLALALAVLAGPVAAMVLGRAPMTLVLALVVALPGLGLLVAARDVAPLPLATALLGLQAMSVAGGLLIGTAPAAIGLLPTEALPAFRLAVLGAGFLPAFAALVAALLGRANPRAAVLAALALALLSAGLGPVLALVDPGFADHAALGAPLLATGFAFWLLARRTA